MNREYEYVGRCSVYLDGENEGLICIKAYGCRIVVEERETQTVGENYKYTWIEIEVDQGDELPEEYIRHFKEDEEPPTIVILKGWNWPQDAPNQPVPFHFAWERKYGKPRGILDARPQRD